ncbi:MAG TPA: hypothetical protein VFZ34_10060 [Blastocatellia bacterium]|nr:hypothetical protein [Blastocatellia bacterium]
MKKSDLKLLNETLDKALDPPRRKPISKAALDNLLDPYDDRNSLDTTPKKQETGSHKVASYDIATTHQEAASDAESQDTASHQVASYDIASRQQSILSDSSSAPASHQVASYGSQLLGGYQANSKLSGSQLPDSQLPDSQPSDRFVLNWRSVEHSRFPNKVYDEILPKLPPMAHSPYLHLLRLTLGFSRKRCRITQETLAKRSNQSLAGIKKQVSYLISCGLLRAVAVNYGGTDRGVEYEPIIPGIFNDEANSQLPDSQLPDSQLRNSHMKEDHDDHDSLKENHHRRPQALRAVESPFEHLMMTKYQQLTGNTWTALDHSVFVEIEEGLREISTQDLDDLMQMIASRATSPIGSFKFFAIAFKNELTEKPILSKKVLRNRYVECAEELHKKFVGKQWESESEKIYEFKRIVLKQILPWNDDLAEEVLSQ